MIEEIASDAVIDQAFDWLCRSRKHAGHNSDVWQVRWRWHQLKPRVQAQLRAGTYPLSPTQRYEIHGEPIEAWSTLDALVLKAMTIVLGRAWDADLSAHCHHVAGRGGAKAAVRRVNRALADNHLVFRTDPDKTFVGRIGRGFDFLGYHYTSNGLVGGARKTLENCATRITRLYEQGADDLRIGLYLQRSARWTTAGLRNVWPASAFAIDDIRNSPPSLPH